MKKYLFILILFYTCTLVKRTNVPKKDGFMIDGIDFYNQAVAMQWMQRDSVAVSQILAGNIPDFLEKFLYRLIDT